MAAKSDYNKLVVLIETEIWGAENGPNTKRCHVRLIKCELVMKRHEIGVAGNATEMRGCKIGCIETGTEMKRYKAFHLVSTSYSSLITNSWFDYTACPLSDTKLPTKHHWP